MPLIQTHTASVAYTSKFYSPSLSRLSTSTDSSDCPSYRPILHQSLTLVNFYNPSLSRLSTSTDSSDCPSYRPILHQLLTVVNFYNLSLHRLFISTDGLSLPYPLDLYCKFMLLLSVLFSKKEATTKNEIFGNIGLNTG